MSGLMAGYTLLTLATLAICALGALARPEGREVLAAALFVVFLTYAMKMTIAMANLLGSDVHPPASMVFYPIQDGAAVCMCAWAYLRQRATWKLALMSCFISQIIGHAVYWGARDGSISALYTYTLWNNLGYLLTMLVLAFTGGKHAGAGIADLWAWHHARSVRDPVRNRW